MSEKDSPNRPMRGRGTGGNPPNRFERMHVEDADDGWGGDGLTPSRIPTTFYRDHSREVLARNESPDLPFDFGLNPYRGCEHGCIYCYARPSHEYLGFSAGLDFESQIMVKPDAAALLAKRFRSPRWVPQTIMLSGNTDCYQPAERSLKITRACLEVCLEFGNPVGVITKGALILRDTDILQSLARRNLVAVTISVTSLDSELARLMEPRASTPGKRLEAIAGLASAGIPVTVNTAPVIPGLNDHEIPGILQEAAVRGARGAGYILLRLPNGVKELFTDWLASHYPHRKEKVLHAIREARGGALNDPRFGSRMKGEGPRAEALKKLFDLHCRRLGLSQETLPLATDAFAVPAGPQLDLPL